MSRLKPVDELRSYCKALADYEKKFSTFSPMFEYASTKNRDFFTYWDDGHTGFVIVFDKNLALIRGYANQSPMCLDPGERMPCIPWLEDDLEFWDNPPFLGVLEDLPEVYQPLFKASLEIPGNRVNEGATFCLWRSEDDHDWNHGDIDFPEDPDPDGSKECLSILSGDTHLLAEMFSSYYEKQITPNLIPI